MTGSNSIHVGILGGTKLPTNVGLFLENLRILLKTHPTDFEFDLIIREEAVTDVDGYRIYDPGIASSERALDMFTSLTPAMFSYVSDHSPDVLFQVTEFAAHGIATVLAGKRENIPTITRVAGDDFNEYKLTSGSRKVKLLGMRNVLGRVPLHFADEIIVLGPHVRSELQGRGRTEGIHELPQPINRENFHPVSEQRKLTLRDELNIGHEERVLLSAGRLTYRKGVDEILRMTDVLADAGDDYRWIVLGSGPMAPQLEAESIVDPRGKIPHSSIHKYYKSSDLFVHPSRIDGLPNVLLEATACGVPSIARNIGECPLIATSTYETEDELRSLITQNYDAVSLDESFEWKTLRERYANLLIETASCW